MIALAGLIGRMLIRNGSRGALRSVLGPHGIHEHLFSNDRLLRRLDSYTRPNRAPDQTLSRSPVDEKTHVSTIHEDGKRSRIKRSVSVQEAVSQLSAMVVDALDRTKSGVDHDGGVLERDVHDLGEDVARKIAELARFLVQDDDFDPLPAGTGDLVRNRSGRGGTGDGGPGFPVPWLRRSRSLRPRRGKKGQKEKGQKEKEQKEKKGQKEKKTPVEEKSSRKKSLSERLKPITRRTGKVGPGIAKGLAKLAGRFGLGALAASIGGPVGFALDTLGVLSMIPEPPPIKVLTPEEMEEIRRQRAEKSARDAAEREKRGKTDDDERDRSLGQFLDDPIFRPRPVDEPAKSDPRPAKSDPIGTDEPTKSHDRVQKISFIARKITFDFKRSKVPSAVGRPTGAVSEKREGVQASSLEGATGKMEGSTPPWAPVIDAIKKWTGNDSETGTMTRPVSLGDDPGRVTGDEPRKIGEDEKTGRLGDETGDEPAVSAGEPRQFKPDTVIGPDHPIWKMVSPGLAAQKNSILGHSGSGRATNNITAGALVAADAVFRHAQRNGVEMRVAEGGGSNRHSKNHGATGLGESIDIKPVGGWKSKQQAYEYAEIAAAAGANRLGVPHDWHGLHVQRSISPDKGGTGRPTMSWTYGAGGGGPAGRGGSWRNRLRSGSLVTPQDRSYVDSLFPKPVPVPDKPVPRPAEQSKPVPAPKPAAKPAPAPEEDRSTRARKRDVDVVQKKKKRFRDRDTPDQDASTTTFTDYMFQGERT